MTGAPPVLVELVAPLPTLLEALLLEALLLEALLLEALLLEALLLEALLLEALEVVAPPDPPWPLPELALLVDVAPVVVIGATQVGVSPGTMGGRQFRTK